MKLYSVLILVAVLVLLPAAGLAIGPDFEEKAEVKPAKLTFISSLDVPPFAYVENFQNKGFEIDLGQALGEELGQKVEWIKQSFNIPALASALNAGRADAVLSALTVTEDRKKYFLFTRPYFRTDLAVAAGRDADWNKLDFKTGLTPKVVVGVLKRSTGEEWARKNLKSIRKTYTSPDRLVRALNNREVAIILIDRPILEWVLARRHYKFKIVEEGIDHQDYAIAVAKNNPKLRDRLNQALEELDRKDIYDRIYQKWYEKMQDLPPIGR